jgi:hypothetical protein
MSIKANLNKIKKKDKEFFKIKQKNILDNF